ncbi:MAG: 3-oxoacyl-ACP reductase [Conexibacter sp.]|nr:3-oxoacyl-ACP reductase [Conexibacter sp.]
MAAPEFRLDGEVVVVVGASRGIGAAVALACAQAGAREVVLLGRDPAALVPVGHDVEVWGARATSIGCDVTTKASIEVAFARMERADVVVYNAGVNQPEPFLEVEVETLDRLIAVNLRGAFLVAQAAVAKMLEGGRGGTIVTISSQMGHVGAARRTAYCATKHAVEGLTKALAVEHAADGIRAVTIAPTFVRTAMTAPQLDDPETGPALLSQIPQGRFGTPEEVAAAVVFVASPAAALMTGTSLVLDGGWTAR